MATIAEALMQPFTWGPGNSKITAAELERQRKIADALRAPQGYAPSGPWSAAGALAGEGVAAYRDKKSDADEKAARDLVAQALTGGKYLDVMSNDIATPQQSAVAAALYQQEQQNSDPLRQLQIEKLRTEIDAANQPQPVEPPRVETRYNPESGREEKVTWNGSTGAWEPFGGQKAPADPLVQVNTGEGSDAALDKALSGKEGELWATYKQAGATAGANNGDFGVLNELIQLAPQGPITGRLAEAFKGFSSAGSAFQSIVKRIAPTLRAPGSGATSDIEYQGMLDSLPALANLPEANRMILSIMQAKADLNMKRSAVVTAYQNGELDIGEARKAMDELDRASIVTPEMRLALNALTPEDMKASAGQAPEGVDQQDWEYMTPEERALWN